MSDRLITDNVLVAFETMHYLNQKKKEGLSALLCQATSVGILRGVAACPHGPRISHLFFADDNIIFCQATREECSQLAHVLDIYEQTSSQQLNREKTSLFFSHNTPQNVQNDIKQCFGAEVIWQYETYLGLPSLVGRSKQNRFRALKERLNNKLSGWKEKMLSQAGKEILINFWWGQSNGTNKITWLSWNKVCMPKKERGLGFHDLKSFNLALLAQQGWWLQCNTRSLVHQVLKACYFPHSDFLHSNLGSRPSIAWRSIIAAQGIVQAGHRWHIGDGASVRIWHDKWLPRPSTYQVVPPQNTLPKEATVSSLINATTGEWNMTLIKQIFLHANTETILSIPLGRRQPTDHLVWGYTPKGNFSVNSAYKITTHCPIKCKTSIPFIDHSTHVVIVSSPQVGHIVCNLELGNRLIVDHNLHVTFFDVAESKASTGESETIQSASAQNLLDIIQLPPVDISSKVEPNSPIFTTFTTIMRETNPLLRSAISALKPRPTALFVDIFRTAALDVAEEFHMLKYVFVTTALPLALAVYINILDKEVEGEYVDQKERLRLLGCMPVQPDDVVDPLMNRTKHEYRVFLQVGWS
ncbi:hypothetical protein SO802_025454 [Lithocarpus litseifolius]|uniref:Reverse transcriptase domain-containing protein n=1 Tax=Lithocarpus litseifolius TaxID=425828 RepID=A0AAW2C0D9_9ROSI